MLIMGDRSPSGVVSSVTDNGTTCGDSDHLLCSYGRSVEVTLRGDDVHGRGQNFNSVPNTEPFIFNESEPSDILNNMNSENFIPVIPDSETDIGPQPSTLPSHSIDTVLDRREARKPIVRDHLSPTSSGEGVATESDPKIKMHGRSRSKI